MEQQKAPSQQRNHIDPSMINIGHAKGHQGTRTTTARICIDEWRQYVSCLACNRPPRQTAVESKKSNARAYQCLWQRTATPWYHDTIIPQWCLSPCHACNRPPRQTAVESKKKQCKSLPMSLTKNSHSMIPWYNHTTVLSQISPVSTPHASSLRHDERARNHKLHRHKPLKTNSGSQHWQTMTMCCIFPVCLKRL